MGRVQAYFGRARWIGSPPSSLYHHHHNSNLPNNPGVRAEAHGRAGAADAAGLPRHGGGARGPAPRGEAHGWVDGCAANAFVSVCIKSPCDDRRILIFIVPDKQSHECCACTHAGDLLGWSWRRRRQEEREALQFLDTMNVSKASLLEHPYGIDVGEKQA